MGCLSELCEEDQGTSGPAPIEYFDSHVRPDFYEPLLMRGWIHPRALTQDGDTGRHEKRRQRREAPPADLRSDFPASTQWFAALPDRKCRFKHIVYASYIT